MKNMASLAIQNAPCEDSDQTAQNAQVDPSLCWAHMSEGVFSDVMAHLKCTLLATTAQVYNLS